MAVQSVDRSDAAALIPEDAAREIIANAEENSAVLGVSRRLPNMSRKQRRLPVWSSLPQAYFVNGDTGQKQTSKAAWDNVFVNAEELAVIVPIPDNVLDDADYDLWTEMRPGIISAFGIAVDQAILYGINAPSDWPDSIVQQCDDTGHRLEEGDNGDLYDDLLGEGGLLSFVEEDGYAVNGHIASLNMRAKMRGLRDTEGQPIFQTSNPAGQSQATYTLDGETLIFPRNGAIEPARSLVVSGDWSQLVYAIRQDITFKVLTEAVIQDTNGDIIFNLAQQDMTALRVVFRLGWALPNPTNRVNPDDATRLPFATYSPQNAS